MKKTELRIGDWVGYHGEPIKIEEISHGLCSGLDNQGNFRKNLILDNVEPIPITGELLEKNGFMQLNMFPYNCYESEHTPNGYTLYYLDNQWVFQGKKLIIPGLTSIHHLQHILLALEIDENIIV